MRTVVVNDRGQIVIPEEIRQDMGLKAGTTLVLLESKNQLLLRKESEVMKMISLADEKRFWGTLASRSLSSAWDEKDDVWESEYAKSRILKKQRDVVWVSVPYAEGLGEKHRPALILSNDQYHADCDDVLVCAITSNLASRRYSILLSQHDFSSGTLPIESRIRADKMVSIHQSLVGRKIGTLSPACFNRVIAEITALIECKG